MNYRLGALEQDKLGNCELTDMKGTIPGTPYDMTLLVTETSAGTSILQFGVQQYLYSNDDTHQLLQAYAHLLNVVSQDPSFNINEYSVFSPEMTNDCLRYAHGDVSLEFASPDTLPAYILQHFKHDFDKIAVKDGYGQILSYGDLGKMVHTLTTKLEAAGIRSSTHVALLCEPSADAVCAMLAIWHCGATCIPLDLSNPVARLEAALNECRSVVTIFHQASHEIFAKLSGQQATGIGIEIHQIADHPV